MWSDIHCAHPTLQTVWTQHPSPPINVAWAVGSQSILSDFTPAFVAIYLLCDPAPLIPSISTASDIQS